MLARTYGAIRRRGRKDVHRQLPKISLSTRALRFMRSRNGVSTTASNFTVDNRTMNLRDVRLHSGEIIGSTRGREYTAPGTK